ncbi:MULTISPECIES: spore coat associated protein CotJA [Aneurinibacillus]|uniref:Spore coat associated protein CotJA n=1 Tax=Aneurinibacillus thermoaerophilus TaxID=143495 RepID=A0A1G7YLI6_ANETH|nr:MULTISPECIES: spore coat associated protein CotJA [Aneurinibacillus]AMA73846.1 spore coat protein CotJA [Aneurinibacillus sp. XH2]MED0676681.1 spore coat associated protein CotJA [Aneurinibacillus thermoaerophilus]MED0679331.1 spore coat associated protein CotJA [Aneurinibacillus thermoaerophilus]MED0738097.1 spore coat associated protein CotJA [Aneurinibacillus thermoaerophilus]MED0756518.1 spore coat associated protein CotJA [Aneurinibacillus thermoaerophilus]
MHTFRKRYRTYVSPFDPCPPIIKRTYETPPQLYMGFQPYGLPQVPPAEALRLGTLWPALYAPYQSPYKDKYGRGGTDE